MLTIGKVNMFISIIKLLKKLFGLSKDEPVVEPKPVPKPKQTRKKAVPKTNGAIDAKLSKSKAKK